MIASLPLLAASALSLALAPDVPADVPVPTDDARADRARGDLHLAPTLGLSLGQTREQLTLEFDDGSSISQSRTLTNTRLELGISYALWRKTHLRVRGQSSAGVGLIYGPGDWPVHLRQDFSAELVPKRWFGAFVGLGVGFDINPNRPASSSFNLALPLGLRLGPVELIYRPSFAVALADEREAVLAGVQRKGARTGFAPFEVALRMRIPARGRG